MATLFKQVHRTPPVGSIHWLNNAIERSKGGVFTEQVSVSPGLAAELLRRNPDNRNIRQTKVDHFVTDILAGRWVENGETIIVSEDGFLNDGQHRMQAVIDANQSLPFIFVFGVSRSSRTTVDQGTARCAGDYLAMDGIHYSKNAATVARFVIAYERSEGQNISARSDITNAEIVARVKADPFMVEAAAYAHKHLKQYRRLVSHTVMASCYYILSEIDAPDAREFLDKVGTGEDIKAGDPAFAVRSAFLGGKFERAPAMEIIFHGWNKFRSGEKAKIVRSRGQFPALI